MQAGRDFRLDTGLPCRPSGGSLVTFTLVTGAEAAALFSLAGDVCQKIRTFLMRINDRISLLLAGLMLLNVSSCAGNSSTSTSTPSAAEPKMPVQASEAKEPMPANEPAEAEEGIASWYGPGFYGNKTTSGDVLQKGTMTAAHSSLPIGTEVKVTRLDTNESVTVEINDRSSHNEGRVIDLAHGAAEALDIDDDGTATVRIEVID